MRIADVNAVFAQAKFTEAIALVLLGVYLKI